MDALAKAREKLEAAVLMASEDGDGEFAHIQADEALIELLTALGHLDIVEAYNRVEPKWYA